MPEINLDTVLDDLVIANRILANEGVIDAFGHVSIRHPRHPDRYFLARSRSPELVASGRSTAPPTGRGPTSWRCATTTRDRSSRSA
jgi:hypothetical protein